MGGLRNGYNRNKGRPRYQYNHILKSLYRNLFRRHLVGSNYIDIVKAINQFNIASKLLVESTTALFVLRQSRSQAKQNAVLKMSELTKIMIDKLAADKADLPEDRLNMTPSIFGEAFRMPSESEMMEDVIRKILAEYNDEMVQELKGSAYSGGKRGSANKKSSAKSKPKPKKK